VTTKSCAVVSDIGELSVYGTHFVILLAPEVLTCLLGV
jgi:hypothetical protein